MLNTPIRILPLILFVVCATFAHPGVGIVMDRKGNVYYTDLKQIWKITPEGRRSVVVRSVHTHALALDSEDNLYGEHLLYEGEATNRWFHRVWKLSPDGKVADSVPERQGFLDDYDDFHFVRDARDNMYWVRRSDTSTVYKRSPDGHVTVMARAKFTDVRWMTVTPDGTLYLTDLYDIVLITSDGAVTTLARKIAGWNLNRLLGPDRHAIMGLWTDRNSNVYAAVFADHVVKRIRPDGTVKSMVVSRAPWSPTGGLTAPNGDLWILECSTTNAVRVRNIRADGHVKAFD